MAFEYYNSLGHKIDSFDSSCEYWIELSGQRNHCKLFQRSNNSGVVRLTNGSHNQAIIKMNNLIKMEKDKMINNTSSNSIEYFDHNKQPCDRSVAVWKVSGNTLEMRVDKKNWSKISLGSTDPMSYINDYTDYTEYYYGLDGYPLKASEVDFAVRKIVEFQNGLAIEFEKYAESIDWIRRVFTPIHHYVKFTYLKSDFSPAKKDTSFEDKKYRLRRKNNTHRLIVETQSGIDDTKWEVTLGEINGFDVTHEVEALLNFSGRNTYLDEDLAECKLESAYYKKVAVNDYYSRIYKKSGVEWKLIFCDSNSELAKIKLESTDENSTIEIVEQTVELPTEKAGESTDTQSNQSSMVDKHIDRVTIEKFKTLVGVYSISEESAKTAEQPLIIGTSNVVNKISSKIAGELTDEQITAYIINCISRNRHIKKTPIINTRLVDELDQPIYIHDYRYTSSSDTIDLSKIWTVDSIAEAVSLYAEIELDYMPAPLQWSDNPSDYIWNPSIPISPINTYMNKYLSKDKLAPEIQNKNSMVLMNEIQRCCEEEGVRASRDISYALPYYDRKTDSILMMLPIKIMIISNKVLNVMLFEKTLKEYKLSGIITVDEAVDAVRLFRDPKTTWLMEG